MNGRGPCTYINLKKINGSAQCRWRHLCSKSNFPLRDLGFIIYKENDLALEAYFTVDQVFHFRSLDFIDNKFSKLSLHESDLIKFGGPNSCCTQTSVRVEELRCDHLASYALRLRSMTQSWP